MVADPKRQIRPEHTPILTVVDGEAEKVLDLSKLIAPTLLYIRIIGPSNAKGRVQVIDEDNSGTVIWQEPEDPTRTVSLGFFLNDKLRIPLNGVYTVKIVEANMDDNYDLYTVVEERPLAK